MNLQENISRIKEMMGLISESDPKTGTGKKPKGSDRRLYTDENPSDTVSVKFRTKEDIIDTLNKDSFKSKPHKRQSQIINLIHQRVRAAYQNAKDPETKKRLKRGLDYITSEKEKSKEKTMNDLRKFIKTTIREFLNENYDGRFDDEYDFTKHNFNTGDCDIYAISLHRLYGHPLCAIRGKFLEPEWGGKREWDYEYCHIMVKLPNGNYMDSDGEQTKQEMISRAAFSEDIKKVEIVQITEEDAINMFSCEDQEKDIQRVIKYIKNK